VKYFCPKNFIFIIDSLIKHQYILKIKDAFNNNNNNNNNVFCYNSSLVKESVRLSSVNICSIFTSLFYDFLIK
jgi:hypothetical protein